MQAINSESFLAQANFTKLTVLALEFTALVQYDIARKLCMRNKKYMWPHVTIHKLFQNFLLVKHLHENCSTESHVEQKYNYYLFDYNT